MTVAFVTDGNNTLGMGHVYQSITTAGCIEQRLGRGSVIFLTKSGGAVVDQLQNAGFAVHRSDSDDGIFASLARLRCHRIVFDKLDVAPELAARIKRELGTKLVLCTNLTAANQLADMTVLADIGSDFRNVRNVDPQTQRLEFFGPRYWILRPEFYALRKATVSHGVVPKRCLLIFGGADPCNYSTASVKVLLESAAIAEMKLIVGSAFANRPELDAVLAARRSGGPALEILESVKNVAELMAWADLVLASPGLSFFEALAVGTPVIGFHQNEPQRAAYAGLLPTYGMSDIPALPGMIESMRFIYPDDPFVAGMEIGRGKDEIIDAILN